MFIRTKPRPNGKISVQIVESYRRADQVSQRIVRHVGQAANDREVEELKRLASTIIAEMENQKRPRLPIRAHGSGVSSALYTGHLAAKTAGPVLKSGADPTAAALWPYGHAYQTGRGAVLATYAAQKLSIDLLSAEQELGLVEDGGMQAEDVYKGTAPAHMGSSLGAIPGRVVGVLKHPDLLPALAKMGLAIGRIRGHYQRYPARYDRVAVEAWKRKTRELFRPLEPKA